MPDADNDVDAHRTDAAVRPPRRDSALLLVESLIHELVARRVLSVPAALGVIEIAVDAQRQLDADWGGSQADDPAQALIAIAASLATDLVDHPPVA